VQGDPARPRALPQGIVMGSGSSQREAEGGCQQRSPHAGASARGRGRRASRCGRPPGFASHRSPRLLAPRSGPRQDRSASTGVRTVASDLLADQSVDAKGLLLGIHARNADVGEDERPSVAMTGSISSCGGSKEEQTGLSWRRPGQGTRVAGPEGAGRGCRKGLGGGGDPSEGRAVPGPWSGRGESRTSDGTHQRPSWGGEVAGARGSGLEGSRKCSRMAWAVEERRTTATTRRVPPQRGQARTSVWKVRLRSSAQGMGWRGRGDRTGSGTRGQEAASVGAAGGGGAGTTRGRTRALGAKTPK
jgi:hypothetical protein